MMLNPANGSNNIGGRNSNRSPFTATQWQELEHQALIFKYMVSGVPVPHELLYSVKRSLESSLASRLFPHQPIGLGCFQAGFGKKTDPEPGRCRRTDGKKWRCSKEAYPDSKYCERHMHRGRNRSRKPVELLITNPTSKTTSSEIIRNHQKSSSSSSTATTSATTTAISPSSSSYSFSPLSNASLEPENIHHNPNNLLNPFLYPPSNSSNSRPPAFSPQNSTTHNLFLDSASSSSSHAHAHHHKDDYRYFHGGDERDFFPEAASGGNTIRCLQDSYNNHQLYKNYSQTDQFLADDSKQLQEQQHCFVLGTDFKSSSRPIKLQDKERDDGDQQTQKPLHHFFGDQWPPKETESWLDLASTSRLHNDS